MPFGRKGKMRASYDGGQAPDAWGTGEGTIGGGWGYVSKNEGSFAIVADEPGGLLQVTLDTADLDNFTMKAGPFRPADGGLVFECRFKMADIVKTDAFIGFTETLNLATPVLPATFSGSAMTYVGSGGMIGWEFDEAGTVDTWRALGGDGGAVVGGADANGTVTTEGAPVNDEFDLFKVEIDTDGAARLYHDEVLVKSIAATGSITPGDNFYAVLMFNTNSGGTAIVEIDYAEAEGWRDWSV